MTERPTYPRAGACSRRARAILVGIVVGIARGASADCSIAELGDLARSISRAFACENARLTIGRTSCALTAPPACAGPVVEDLISLGGTADVEPSPDDRRTLGFGMRCQRAIVQAIGRFARDRLLSAVRGLPGREADAHAVRALRRISMHCSIAIEAMGDGRSLPRAGAPCDATSPAGTAFDAVSLTSCLRTTIGARLEPLLRKSLKPSIVVILTDDQPAWMLGPMQTVETDLIGDRGVTFGSAIGTTPLCAPSRASILTGRYAHAHGVLDNFSPHGFFAFDDSSTIATWLHDDGYRTALFGKYLNGYNGNPPPSRTEAARPYVPPGWDEWHAFTALGFFDYSLAHNHTQRSYGSAEADYSTDVLATAAVDFIRSSGRKPFFMVFAPYAPHEPATPAPRHAGRYAGIPPWRPLNYDEADVSDKAWWLRERTPPLAPEMVEYLDGIYPAMLESLLAVDEAIESLLAALRETGRDEDTLVVFMSDNGLALGSHRCPGKICPYEECLRVPFVVRYPRLVTAARLETRQVANIDLAPTIAEFAGITPQSPVDGVSVASLLDGSASTWREDVMAEQWTVVPTEYRAIRTERFAYIEYRLVPPLHGQEAELYDLDADPFQLSSVDGNPAYREVQSALAARVRALDAAWRQSPPM